MPEPTKLCRRCGQVKPLSEFHRRSDRASGRQAKCAVCACEVSRLYKAAHPEATLAQRQKWNAAHPKYSTEWARKNRQRHLEHRQSSRARTLGLFVEDVDRWKLWQMFRGRCGICFKAVGFEEFHIDHIRSLFEGGEHSYANTQPSHGDCNKRKAMADRRAAAKRISGRDVGQMPDRVTP